MVGFLSRVCFKLLNLVFILLEKVENQSKNLWRALEKWFGVNENINYQKLMGQKHSKMPHTWPVQCLLF